jgi:hypothetical protein
MDVAQGSDLT